MIDNQTIRNITVKAVEDGFYNYFSKPKKETKHIILDRFFPEERRLSSAMSGLQTSLGLFWEELAKTFAQGNEFTVIDNSRLVRPSEQPAEMTNLIEIVKSRRQNIGGKLDDLRLKLNELYPTQNLEAGVLPMQKGKGSDIILEKDDIHYIYDIKTVQVSADSGNLFNERIILWLCYYKYRYGLDAHNIQARIAIPYNPLNENDVQSWWNKFGGRMKPLTTDEVSVGNEFWSFLTGNPNALASIISGFEELRLDKDFTTFYKQVFECTDYESLKSFAFKVKIRRAQYLYNIKLNEGQNENARCKLAWTHTIDGMGCQFRARVGALQSGSSFSCGTCNRQLP